MVGEPSVTRDGPDYVIAWPEIECRASKIKEHSDGYTAFLKIRTVQIPGISPGTVFESRIQLAGPRSKSDAAKLCESRVEGMDWLSIIERICHELTEALEEGEPIVLLSDDEVEESDSSFLLMPLVRDNSHSLVFGPGGTGKSLLCLAMAAAIETGNEDFLGLPGVGAPLRTLYLDYEDEAAAHKTRLRQMVAALGVPLPDIRYKRADVSLPAMADSLSRQIARERIHVLFVDSAAFACGVDPEKAGVATEYFRTLRAIRVPCSVTIAHQVKHGPGKEDDRYPFGCYSDDTEILTKTGWKLHSEWLPDEAILCFDPNTEKNEWHVPTKRWEYRYDGKMHRFCSPGTDVLVTPNHRMVVAPRWQRRKALRSGWEFIEASTLSRSQWASPYAAPQSGNRQLGAVDLGIAGTYRAEPFMRLLGWWISEGSINDGALSFSQAQGKNAEAIKATLNELMIPYSVWEKKWEYEGREHEKPMCYVRTKRSVPLAKWIADNCGVGARNKRIPALVYEGSEKERSVFLEALMAGDGHWGGKNRGTYTTISPQLADDVQMLAILMGYAANKSAPRMGPKSVWPVTNVRLVLNRPVITLRSERHHSVVPYAGVVYCFTVPTGAYVTRRNGKMAVQGNSIFWWNSPRNLWRVKAAKDENTGDLHHIGLFHEKANNGRLEPPLGRKVSFADGLIRFSHDSVTQVDAFRSSLSLKDQIVAAVRHGRMLRSEIATAVDKPYETVKARINELLKAGKLDEDPVSRGIGLPRRDD